MIAIIIGTKAELIKCAPIMLELQKRKHDYWFIHTGQHPLKKACKEFGVKKPDFILSKEPKISTKFWSKVSKHSILWSLSMIFKIRKLIRKLKPNYVIYHGDTMSSAMAAIASSKILNLRKKWKNVHLEAGLRSESLKEPFPEEISRRICDRFSDILLAVSERSKNNLKKEKQKGKIIKIGNTIIDSALISYRIAKKKYKIKEKNYALVNFHRHENLKSKEKLTKMINILSAINIKIVWPIHDNTKHYLKKYNLFNKIKKNKNIKIMSLVNYFDFINMLANCKYLITDGGSIQEESLVFKKPCILLRERTERQEGLKTGINFLTKLNVNSTIELIKQIEKNKIKVRKFENPYGKPGISKKIGCGKNKYISKDKKDEVIGLDRTKLLGVDIVHDIEKFPWPFKDNEFDLIIANHILEHLDNLIKVMEEIWRITKNNGLVKINVPYFSYSGAFQDPTHKRFFTLHTFDYFTENSGLNYYSKARFKILKKRLVFFVRRPKANKIINFFINSNQRFYERFLSNILPAENLYVKLEVIK